MSSDLIGRTLLGRYRVAELVGHGGMADVYRIHDTQRAVSLAIKVLRPDLAAEAHLNERFSQEAQLLEELNHPHIVRFYEWHRSEELVFIVMDYVDGSDLRRVIKDRGRPFGPAEILHYLRPVSSAVHYAHQKPVYHCDIKPSNILIGREGGVYVSDFGVASLAAGAGSLGTPTHMAPEQFERHAVDARTDIYALGVMLYELATGGSRPFSGESPGSSGSTPEEQIGWEHVHRPPPPPGLVNPAVLPDLEAIILRALEKRPQDRFFSTLELLQALEEVSARYPAPSLGEILTSVSEAVRSAVKVSLPESLSRLQMPTIRIQPEEHRPVVSPRPARGAKAYVLVRVGDRAGQWFPVIGDLWVIGRSREAHHVCSSHRVSRRHAAIRRGRGYYYIQDLGSTLGTFVNGRRVTAQALRSGDVILLGDVELEFRETK